MADPYQTLGVSPDASDDEIKRAYRRLAKKYHPDANPGDPMAAQKMQEINAAYDQIKNPEKYRTQSSGGGQSDPFGGYSYGYDPFRGYYQQSHRQEYEDSYKQAAYNYLRFGRYREALNVLDQMEYRKRDAQWYYLSALANEGLGNQILALEHIRKAVSMDPANQEYLNELNRMEQGGQRYRTQAEGYRGFQVHGDPCSNLCMCFLCNMFCTPYGFCCC